MAGRLYLTLSGAKIWIYAGKNNLFTLINGLLRDFTKSAIGSQTKPCLLRKVVGLGCIVSDRKSTI